MPYLPNELWLAILPYCQTEDSWRSLRPVNQQLRACVEQYFLEEILPETVISLPITLPTYDIRQAMRGHARLRCLEGALVGGRAIYALAEAVPAHYDVHFRARWKRVHAAGGRIPDKQRWEVQLCDIEKSARVKDARVEGDPEDCQLSFDWKPTLTAILQTR
ncbi:hypothetical protein LTR08_004952 [Meristemomyces frigidus]|nr:hypothetical protein LTR08_004952 [Meristemomyces frigidus]